jgi:hypothetical protein
MLQIEVGLLNLINQGMLAPFVLIEIAFPSGSVRLTDAPRDITYNSNVYTADGGIMSMSPPSVQGEVSRDLFDIVLGDADNAMRTLLDSENIGVPVNIHAGFFVIATNAIHNEFLDIYHGIISSASWVVEDDNPSVTIQCSGPLTKLHQVINRTTTSASQNSFYPADTSMDLSYDSSNETTIKWGGIS